MPISPSRNPSPSALATLDKVAARTPDGATLFDNLSLTFGPERTGVVGRNGAGKSTLLRLISGEAAPAEGAVARAGTIGVLDQRYEPAPDETVARTLGVESALAVVARVLAGQGTADDLAEADWTLETRLDEALREIGLPDLDHERLTCSLSGGEQTRLRLAGL
jgi:ATPase subunit of ABC transporter with duplicated ATPase domains